MTKLVYPGRVLVAVAAVLFAGTVAIADKGGQGKGGGKPGKSASHGASKSKGGGHGNAASKSGNDSKAKGPKKFESSDRSAIQSYYRDEYASSGNCPPGLAKKNNGCMPPGQARKWDVGSTLPADVYIAPVPVALRSTLVAPLPGYDYGYVDGGVVLFGTGSRVVVDFVAVFP
jgi:hypothetical protein